MDEGAPLQRTPARDARIMLDIEMSIQRGDIVHAQELARTALASGLVHPKLLHLRSFWWARQGLNAEALRDLRAAVEMAPEDVLVRNAYGILLSTMEQWPQSIEQLRAVIRIKPDFAPAHVALGWSMEGAGDLDVARSHYEMAIALNPNFVEAMVRLAALAYRRADWRVAREMSERALRVNPDQYAAAATLAAVAVIEGNLDRAEDLIHPLLARKPGSPQNGAMVRRALGDLRHAQGRYAQAFTAYSASNREKYALYAPQYESARNAASYSAGLADYFEHVDASRWSVRRSRTPDDGRDGAKGHVFLIGFPRSGTTLLENVLASHPDICTLSERDAFGDLPLAYLDDANGFGRLAGISAAEVEAARAIYWSKVRGFGERVAGKVLVDKMPLATMKLPLVAKLFPKAKILFALRDPRDVVLSCFRRNFGMNPAMFELLSLERAARFYAAVMRLSVAARQKFELEWHEIRNEALIENFEGRTREVCAFIDVQWDARMRDFADHARARTIRTPSSIQVVRGINSDGIGHWRHYKAQLEPVMPILMPWVERFGYNLD